MKFSKFLLGIGISTTLVLSSISVNAQDEIKISPIQVAKNTYFVQGLPEMGSSKNQNFISNSGFVVTPQGVVVVDGLGSPVLAEKMLKAISKITSKKVIAVILTHYHADHIYGTQVYKSQGATIYAQYRGKDYLNSDTALNRLEASRKEFAPWVNDKTHLVSADVWIKENKTLHLGGVEFQMSHVGPAHTPEDLMIYVPSEKVLFVGDLVFRGRVPYVGNADSRGWLQSLSKIERLDVSVIIPGHGAYSPDPKRDVEFTKTYLEYLRESMGSAARNMDSFDEAYQQTDWSEYEGMPLFRAANRMNAYNVYLSIQGE